MIKNRYKFHIFYILRQLGIMGIMLFHLAICAYGWGKRLKKQVSIYLQVHLALK